ncbi:T9SS type A sorting domain-containing protein, partial [bacterium]|nr:T9SS type A sorting domain-containing protein [bacterium]
KSAERWHFGRVLLHPNTQPDQVFATFFADDDNDNMDDGTPHHAQFCEAATNHGFDCPEVLVGVFVYHTSRPYSGNQSIGYPVIGQAVSLGGGAIVPGSVQLHYRVNGGGFSNVAMSGTGNPDEYAGTIPAQSWGSVVEYYITASNTLGASGSSPASAPAALHYFQVDDQFVDEMETQTAWHIGSAAEETASTGNWERADPQPTTSSGGQPVQPGDDHTPTGTLCWVTGAAAGSSPPGSSDVDGGQTVLYSPRFDLAGASDVSISYWRWYTNNLGNNPGTDYWTVQLTNDDGATWTNVEYTTASSNAWTNVVFDLDTYYPTPGVVQLRFIASDVSPGSLVEALVDDFLLMGSFDLSGVDEGVSAHFVTRLDQNNPNPFNPKTEIRFSLSQPGPASLRIFDAQGRLVKSLAEGNLAAGPQSIVWDGTDSQGQRVSSGVYFYRLETAEQTVAKRMVLLK